jgi:hypothetical protein
VGIADPCVDKIRQHILGSDVGAEVHNRGAILALVFEGTGEVKVRRTNAAIVRVLSDELAQETLRRLVIASQQRAHAGLVAGFCDLR